MFEVKITSEWSLVFWEFFTLLSSYIISSYEINKFSLNKFSLLNGVYYSYSIAFIFTLRSKITSCIRLSPCVRLRATME